MYNKPNVSQLVNESRNKKLLDYKLREQDFGTWIKKQRKEKTLEKGKTDWLQANCGKANYTGEMRDGKACGYGTVHYDDPDTVWDWKEHKGLFDRNLKNGKGVGI